MGQYDTLNLNLSPSQLNKLKSGIENGTNVTLNLSWNVVGNSNDQPTFPHKSLLTTPQASMICKAHANDS